MLKVLTHGAKLCKRGQHSGQPKLLPMRKKTDRNLACRSHERGSEGQFRLRLGPETRTKAPRTRHPLWQDVELGQEDQDLCPGSMPSHTFSWMTEMYQGTRFLG